VPTVAQLAALGYVRDLARRDPAADQRAAAVLARAGIEAEVSELCSRVAMAGRVALNFHPDRVAADGRMVVEGLLSDGVYRSQFETGIPNGGLGAVRERFEARLFAGVYERYGVSPADRPRCGGLDLVGHPDGPCPRFGSCHLRLRPEVLDRCSFSFGGCVTEPTAVGTIDAFEPVLAALVTSLTAEAASFSSRSVVGSEKGQSSPEDVAGGVFVGVGFVPAADTSEHRLFDAVLPGCVPAGFATVGGVPGVDVEHCASSFFRFGAQDGDEGSPARIGDASVQPGLSCRTVGQEGSGVVGVGSGWGRGLARRTMLTIFRSSTTTTS